MNSIRRDGLITQISATLAESYIFLSETNKEDDVYKSLQELVEVCEKALKTLAAI